MARLECPPVHHAKMQKWRDCAPGSLQVITMTLAVTLSQKDAIAIARAPTSDMILFRFQQRPLAAMLGTDGTGPRGRENREGLPGGRREAWERCASEPLPTYDLIFSPSYSTPGSQTKEIAPETHKIQTRFKRGG